MKLLIIFLIVHIFIFFLIVVLKSLKAIKCDGVAVFTALLIPIWGLLMLFCQVVSDAHSNREANEIDTGRMQTHEAKKSISIDRSEKDVVPISEAMTINDEKKGRELVMDILYGVSRSITVDEDTIKEKVVPLEEALVVNDTATRRSLIIDVLYSNPNDYISQLYEAKANGDTEVVHYAATALAEIQKEYDLAFQSILKRRALNPDDKNLENEYLVTMERYINSNLLTGDALNGQLRKYCELLEEKLNKNEIKGRWSLLNKKANADLKLRDVMALDHDIELMMEHWPDRDGVYRFKMQSAMLKKDSSMIKSIIAEIYRKDIHVSSELKNLISFWEN